MRLRLRPLAYMSRQLVHYELPGITITILRHSCIMRLNCKVHLCRPNQLSWDCLFFAKHFLAPGSKQTNS